MDLVLDLRRTRFLVGETLLARVALTNTGAAPAEVSPVLHRWAVQPTLTLTGPGRFSRGVSTPTASPTRGRSRPVPAPPSRLLEPGETDDTLLPIDRMFELERAPPGDYRLEARYVHGDVDLRAAVELSLVRPEPRAPVLAVARDERGRLDAQEAAFLQPGGGHYLTWELIPRTPPGATRPARREWKTTRLAEESTGDAEPFLPWRAHGARDTLARWVGWGDGADLWAAPFLAAPRPIHCALGDAPREIVGSLAAADGSLLVVVREGAALGGIELPPQELGEAPRPARRLWSLRGPPGYATGRVRPGPDGGPVHLAAASTGAAGVRVGVAQLEGKPRWSDRALAPGVQLVGGSSPALHVGRDGSVRVAVVVEPRQRPTAPGRSSRRCVSCVEAVFAPDGGVVEAPREVGHLHAECPAPPVGGLVRYPLAPPADDDATPTPAWLVAVTSSSVLPGGREPTGAADAETPIDLPVPLALPLVGERVGDGLRLIGLPPALPPAPVTVPLEQASARGPGPAPGQGDLGARKSV